MIYSYLDGQLGNILFEIAAGASLAKRLGVPFKAIGCHPFSLSGTITEYVKPFQRSVLRKIDFWILCLKMWKYIQSPVPYIILYH